MNVFDTEKVGRFDHPAEPLSAAWHQRAGTIIARYPKGQERSALLPLLYLAQSEHNFVSQQAMGEIASLLGLTRAEVQAVATFYTMFKRAPVGQWLVSVCTQPSCSMAGGRQIFERLRDEIDSDQITVEEVECLCACDGAPVFSINYENYEGLGVDASVDLIKALADGGQPPAGARGSVPPTFADVSREMAGTVEG